MTGMLQHRSNHGVPSRWERLLSRSVPLWGLLLAILLGFVVTILFGSLVRTAATSGRAGAVAMEIATVPRTVRRLLHGHMPDEPFHPYYGGAYYPLPNGFWRNAAQPFVDPGYVLLTAFDDRHLRPVVRLLRLSDGKVVHEYRPDIDAIIDPAREYVDWGGVRR